MAHHWTQTSGQQSEADAAISDSAAVAGRPEWHALEAAQVEAALGTGPRGLSAAEAEARLTRFGPNQLPEERRPSRVAALLLQFRSPLILILLVAGVVTAFLGEYVDTGVIAAVAILNAAIGFVQERRAEHAVRALMQLMAPRARVVREAKIAEVASRNLVPGDLVLLESGARVPADVRLVATTALGIDESPLTGESVPVAKRPTAVPEPTALPDRIGIAHAGTTVTSGRGQGYVVATGEQTELGAIATEMRGIEGVETPLQARMGRFARLVGVAVVVSAALAFAIGVASGETLADMFNVAVALAVSAVPEGLPVAFTIALAVGVRRMAQRRAIVRRLPAVETLGSTTVIGSDKTGTLTENRMTVEAIWAGGRTVDLLEGTEPIPIAGAGGPACPDGNDPLASTLLTGVLTNEAEVARVADGFVVRGDPTEGALLVAAARLGIEPEEVRAAYRVVDELPFEPEQQYSASVRERDGSRQVFVKGAPERVLAMCDRMLGPDGEVALDPRLVHEAAHDLASRGLRVLAMAHGHETRPWAVTSDVAEPTGLTLAGLQGMMDPPRPGAREAIAACQRAGIRVLMVTGDHAATARAIGRTLGIAGEDAPVVTGAELAAMDDEALARRLPDVAIYARVAPEHKLRVVRALQGQGHVVAVTGDGVNDAPALRAADIGIAMGERGTDVAREAADMVLADDNFASIAAAVEEGRITFDNVRKTTFFLLSTNAAELLTLLVALVLRWPLPLLAAQILWLNLVTDSLQATGLAFEPGEPGVLRRRPRARREGILSGPLWERVALSAVVMAAVTLLLFRTELDRTGSLAGAQTSALTTMVLFQTFQAGNARSEERSVFRLRPLANPFLFVGTAAALAVHVAALYLPPTQYLLRVEPIGLAAWIRVVLVAATILVVVELHKLLRRQGFTTP